MPKALISGVLAALLLAGACSAQKPPPTDTPRALQAAEPDDTARAAYERYQRWYAGRKQQLRNEAWEAMQRRAAQQQAEREREKALREAYIQQRWQNYR